MIIVRNPDLLRRDAVAASLRQTVAIVSRPSRLLANLLGSISVRRLWSVGVSVMVPLAMFAFAKRGLATRIDIPRVSRNFMLKAGVLWIKTHIRLNSAG